MPVASPRRALDIDALASAVEEDFAEMPGLQLTEPQLRRLWNLSRDDCSALLTRLLERGRLTRDGAGRYLRRLRS